jgi:site-specific DNA-methyltransferase (adenine-specific)
MIQTSYNPDVLTCLANLSNDEVFTPPSLVNDILDLLPNDLWSNPDAKFLDPVSKSGVFLREIAKRLDKGLESKISNKQERINHIFNNQIYGIAITELTSLLSRRSVYGSKIANGKYSFCDNFKDEQGNIRYERLSHTWQSGKCIFCGASQEVYDREDELETYAYNFIHTNNPEKLFNMKFDVIIGNPPYQLNDGGGTGSSAMPIYNKFIEQSIKLNPNYLIMIIPSRWFSGGRGLDEFRKKMIEDKRIKEIHDFIDAGDCFPGVEIKGGVNYFIWDKNYNGECEIFTYENGKLKNKSKRPLKIKGLDFFIRHNESISILNKIQEKKEKSFSMLVSANDPFGFDVREDNSYKRVKPNYQLTEFKNSVKFYYNEWYKKGLGYIDKSQVRKNKELIDEIKILITKGYGAGEGYPHQIINKPFIVSSNSCCTETYLVIGACPNLNYAENVLSYIQTKFFRFLVMLKKNTQGAYKPVYELVPIQNFGEAWTDEKLYKKYNLTNEEITFIDSMIRPMDLSLNNFEDE